MALSEASYRHFARILWYLPLHTSAMHVEQWLGLITEEMGKLGRVDAVYLAFAEPQDGSSPHAYPLNMTTSTGRITASSWSCVSASGGMCLVA
jgi:hypothetical protein